MSFSFKAFFAAVKKRLGPKTPAEENRWDSVEQRRLLGAGLIDADYRRVQTRTDAALPMPPTDKAWYQVTHADAMACVVAAKKQPEFWGMVLATGAEDPTDVSVILREIKDLSEDAALIGLVEKGVFADAEIADPNKVLKTDPDRVLKLIQENAFVAPAAAWRLKGQVEHIIGFRKLEAELAAGVHQHLIGSVAKIELLAPWQPNIDALNEMSAAIDRYQAGGRGSDPLQESL